MSAPAKKVLRFITCGSVDDGKSTLIGRLLHDSKNIFEDQMAALTADSRKFGTTGDTPDFALLLDGLSVEREQGITIDVAYRFFSTPQRKFIVADTPGHEQYTRNMATGASTADLAIIIVDARKGVLPQTRRHSFILSLMGIRHVVLAVNKMDTVNYDETIFRQIEENYAALVKSLGIENVYSIPISALCGENVIAASKKMPWHKGPPLLEYLENAEIDAGEENKVFRMPVQWVNRPHQDFRGYAGRVVSGVVRKGDSVRVLPSGRASSVAKIITYSGELEEARRGQSVTLTLADELDTSRGDVIVAANDACGLSDFFEANLVWFSEKPLVSNRQYIFRQGTVSAFCTPDKLKCRIDINTLKKVADSTLEMNEIGICNITLDRIVAFEPYTVSRDLGAFILIDRLSNETVAAGTIREDLRKSGAIYPAKTSVDRNARAALKGQKPCVIWMTGLSGAGKSTIANALEKKLHALGRHTMLLDGDNIRKGLSQNLSFAAEDRAENIRRIAEVSKLMTEAGLITIVSFISPFRVEREMAKALIGEETFMEIFVDAPLEVAEARDTKGLYKKAREGKIPNFTGISSPYEPPETPGLTLDTTANTPESLADKILDKLRNGNFI